MGTNTLKAATTTVSGILDKALEISKLKKKEAVVAYAEMTDEQLILAVQEGDDDAYAHVINRYQGKIFSYVMRLMNHRDEAHDIVQQVFFKAYKSIHRFDTDRKFSSWVYRIAHNESVNWLKKKTKIKMESLDARVENTGMQVKEDTDIHLDLVVKQEINMVREAINQLPDKYRDVMLLRYVEQLSYDEISKQLNKPVNTVGTLINRAKKQLATEIEEYYVI